MKATLLFPNREITEQYYVPLIYTACRTCYSELEPHDIFERATSGQVASERQQDLVRRVIDSGHGSTIEHIVFTFAISGVTRTLSHQLVRHRAGLAFDQPSQRYLDYKRPAYMVPGTIADAPDDLRDRYETMLDGSLAFYSELLEAGELRNALVHNRLGEPCPQCGTPIARVDFEEHTIYYCPSCQTGGRLLKDRRLSRLLR